MTEEELENTTSEESADVSAESELVDSNGEASEAEVKETTEAEEAVTDAITELQEKLSEAENHLAEAEKKAAEYLDGWQRSQASFANFRKRTEAEQTQLQAVANARLLSRILPVLDDFKRAFEAVPEEYQDDSWLEGLRLVERKLKTVMDSENVKPIEAAPGEPFDPHYHQAVLYQEVEGFDEGEIVAEVETGYLLGDRILRPSLVVVAKGAAEPASEEIPSAESESTDGGSPATTDNVTSA